MGQKSCANAMINLLKNYLAEKDETARKEIAKAVSALARRLEELPDAGRILPRPPRV